MSEQSSESALNLNSEVVIFRLFRGMLPGLEWRFPGRPGLVLVAGRAPGVDLLLDHPTVSRKHVKFSWIPVGREQHLLMEDLGSAGGTLVNGDRFESTFLKSGDRIRIGDFEVVFDMEFESSPAASRGSDSGADGGEGGARGLAE